MTIKISDLLNQKEISKYITSKDKLISLIKKFCEFFKISEDQETIEYTLPENMTVFNILNIPLNMNKEDVIKNIELINLQYSRLYKRGFYWVLCTADKETVICLQNSLRDLYLEESKVKYDLNNKNQILRNMKEQIEKNLYQKDTKNLGIIGNNKSKNNFNKGKISDSDSGAFSWRKGSNDIKSSFDVNDKQKQQQGHIILIYLGKIIIIIIIMIIITIITITIIIIIIKIIIIITIIRIITIKIIKI